MLRNSAAKMYLMTAFIWILCLGDAFSTGEEKNKNNKNGQFKIIFGTFTDLPPHTTFAEYADEVNSFYGRKSCTEESDSHSDHTRERRAVINDDRRYWAGGILPYTLHSSSAPFAALLTEAINDFHAFTCIRLINRTTETNWVQFRGDQPGCYSQSIGKKFWQQGSQDINLANGCYIKGTVLHEIMHALGWFHEHTRPDRDGYVKINWENIQSGKQGNFNKQTIFANTLGSSYDYNGVMHYGERAFSINYFGGLKTIELINGADSSEIQLGQRVGFSKTDIIQINALYQCKNESGPVWTNWTEWKPCVNCSQTRERYCFRSNLTRDCPGANQYGIAVETRVCSTIANCTNECADGTHNCSNKALCNDTETSFVCTCNAGYTGNGTHCDDVDECTLNSHICDINATCTNTEGSYTCSCNSGYTGNGLSCMDINECATNNSCNTQATCTNTEGSFTCACNPGYYGDGLSCLDVNECTLNTDNCGNNSVCENAIGSFNCFCNAGYTGDGVTCNDIDECGINTDNCSINAACINTEGGYNCVCNSGYSGDGVTCSDECQLQTHNCDVNAICTAASGSINCTCNTGFSGNGTVCHDIDECSNSTLNNCDSSYGSCTNTIGSYICTCNLGFTGNGVNCTDINECAINSDNCNGQGQVCINTFGSFTCGCDVGYSGNETVCTDIDECSNSTLNNCDSSYGSCTNTIGSYICTCNLGFTGNGVNCTDINECAINSDTCNGQGQVCINTFGSFTCGCDVGYSGNETVCTDIDECSINTSNCNGQGQVCSNTKGSFLCICDTGYTGNGTVCTDIDECATNIHDCNGQSQACSNTEGSFTCVCDVGYTGNGTICTDINECEVGSHRCHTQATCCNSPGSFDCFCNVGYSGDGQNCTVTTYAQDNCNVRLTSKIVSFYGFESFQPVETNECEGTCFSQSIQDSCNATILREHCRCCRPDVIVKQFVDFRWINPFFKFPVNSVVDKHFSSLRVNFGVSITKSCRCGPCN